VTPVITIVGLTALTLLAGSVPGYVVPSPPLVQDDPKVMVALAPEGRCEYPRPALFPGPPLPPVKVLVEWERGTEDSGAVANLGEITPKPLSAQRLRWQADAGPTFWARCTLHIDGRVGDCSVMKGLRGFGANALRDLEHWRFTPAARCVRDAAGAERVEAVATVRIILIVHALPPSGR